MTMVVWVLWGVLFFIMGLMISLLENWARGEVIPHWRILIVGTSASVIAGLVTVAVAGGFIPHIPIIVTIAALMVDRVNDRMRQGL